jgi:hypothetical protein
MDLIFPRPGKRGKRQFNTSIPAVRKWIENLPLINIEASVQQLEFALDEINTAEIPASVRHDALELLTAPVIHISEALKKSYLGKQFPLGKRGLEDAARAAGLYQRMAASYKILVAAMARKPDSRTGLTIAIHRAMRYLSEVLIGNYQIYAPCQDGIWKDLHTLYAIAEQYGLQYQAVKDITQQDPVESTIENTYKQILLLSLACPHRLRQTVIREVYRLLGNWAPYSKLLSVSEEDSDAFFTWSLEADSAPAYLTDRSQNERDTHWRTLNTSGMAEPVDAALKARRENSKRYSGHLEERVLQRLMLSWGVMPKRRFVRQAQDAPVHVVLGLRNVHQILTGPEPERQEAPQAETEIIRDREYLLDPTFERPTTIDITAPDRKTGLGVRETGHLPDHWLDSPVQGTAATVGPPGGIASDSIPVENWKMQDMSAGGYCLLWDSEETTRAQIGELVSIKTSHDNNDNWHLGVIRWMKYTRERGLGLGVEIMSHDPSAIRASVCDDKSSANQKMQGILLPDVKELRQQATLLLPPLLFHTDCRSNLFHGNKQEQIVLTRLLEDTGSYAQFDFFPVEESGDQPGTGTARG